MEDIKIPEKRLWPIFYAVDTSASMSGKKLADVNEVMCVCEAFLKEIEEETPYAEMKVCVLTFSSEARWVTGGGPVPLKDFFWEKLQNEQAKGISNLGAAISEIESKLSRSEFFTSETRFLLPVIIFISDGHPDDDWQKALMKAKTNNWFKHARIIAVAVGDDANQDVLAKVTGSVEAVIKGNWLHIALKSLFRTAYCGRDGDRPIADETNLYISHDAENTNSDMDWDVDSDWD